MFKLFLKGALFFVAALLLFSIVTKNTQSQEIIPQVDGKYVNNCINYAAMAAAVVYVRDNKIFTLEQLIKNQIEYFRKSDMIDVEVDRYVRMIARVWVEEPFAAPDEHTFRKYGAICIQETSDMKKM